MSIFLRIRSFFARDRYAFWSNEITNEEKELARKDVWQLAAVIRESIECNRDHQRRIVAEHLLGVRLAKIQANASHLAAWISLLGVLLSVALGYYLGRLK